MFNRSWSEPVETGLETAKDRKRPVYCGSVRFFAGLQKMKTGLGLGLWPLRLKTETRPDFQSLGIAASLIGGKTLHVLVGIPVRGGKQSAHTLKKLREFWRTK